MQEQLEAIAKRRTLREGNVRTNKQLVASALPNGQCQGMSRSKPLRDVGERIRSVLDKSLTDQVVQKAMEDVSCAVDDSVVTDVTQRLCEEFGSTLAQASGLWNFGVAY